MKFYILATLLTLALFSADSAAINEQDFFDKRTALIIKHSHHDKTFEALQQEESFSREYWRWRVDQYMYGQYPEFQAIYDAYTEGKTFLQIYDLPEEQLGPEWQEPNRLPEIPQGDFSGNLPGNAHTGWHKLVGDKLYITYQGHLTDPYVASYDLKSHKWDGPYKAGHSTLSKDGRKIDSHGRPIIEVDSQGYIHIIFGGHGGEREDGLNPLSIDTPHAGGRMIHVVSTKPHDLSEFVEKDDISPFASYTKSYQMANGDIYFFTRAGTHKSPWLYYKMKNGSQTFEPPVKITWPTVHQDNPILVDTFYINPLKVSDTEIVITSLWHECNFKEEHNKTHYNRLNAYFMRLDTTTDTFYNIQNKALDLPVTLAAANRYTLAYDSEAAKETSFGTRPLVLKDGSYALAYEARGEGYREWRMASFNDGTWQHGQPMPGTANRRLLDTRGNDIKAIQSLEALTANNGIANAVVVYKNAKGESVFALARSIDSTDKPEDETKETWMLTDEYFKVAGARIELQTVKGQTDENIAFVLNVRKGASQRLYLWHEGKIRSRY
ncbi:BNR-4 repeat-containing protein [Glaciecola sp. SC05]|uniref:BNR-4 repeat-containing protein n=1 Tax=Glaciecola sp. SC05 TaxID=1987355 RepID=UPI003527B1AA